MNPSLSRRRLLKFTLSGGALLAAGHPALRALAAAQPPSMTAADTAAGMAAAAGALLDALSAENRARVALAFDSEVRLTWGWTPGFPRNGVRLVDMAAAEKEAAYALLAASTSEIGYRKALEIMSLQFELGRDGEAYFVTVYGQPGTTGAWGWRLEGHHLSMHFTSVDGQLSLSPMFLGARPTHVQTPGPRFDLRAMAVEEESARALAATLTNAQRAAAIIDPAPARDILTANARTVSPLVPRGIPVTALSAEQQALARAALGAYIDVWPAPVAEAQWAQVEAEWDSPLFGWQGSTGPGVRYSYFIQGLTYLLDHNNVRDNATHIHSVWRNFNGDFGLNWLG